MESKICRDCKEKCFPGNPSEPFFTRSGYVLPPLCRYCNNLPDGEAPEGEMKIEPKWTAPQWDYVQQLKGQILHLEHKVDKLYERKKQSRKDRI